MDSLLKLTTHDSSNDCATATPAPHSKHGLGGRKRNPLSCQKADRGNTIKRRATRDAAAARAAALRALRARHWVARNRDLKPSNMPDRATK